MDASCVYCGRGPVFDHVCPTCQASHGLANLPYDQWPLGVRVILEARREAQRLRRAACLWNGQLAVAGPGDPGRLIPD